MKVTAFYRGLCSLRRVIAVAIAIIALTSAERSTAAIVRYALVIGNNHSQSPDGLRIVDLQHAEREALELKQSLLRYAQFDEKHIEVVIGKDRAAILAAAKRLALLQQKDREEFTANAPTLFALFFTGHGYQGKLLTQSQALTGRDLDAIFKAMHASINIGFFDACFSESLEAALLEGKGAESTYGFNPLTALPEELLHSEGMILFASSRPDQQSYEDKRYGGLFTHYFIEAFSKAPVEGIAISLDRMWDYTRQRTAEHASRFGRKQTPVKMVLRLKERAPLYFSFPRPRTANIYFAPQVSGSFLIDYQQGALIERVVKVPGRALDVPLYPGVIRLQRIEKSALHPPDEQNFVVAEGETVWIRSHAEFKPIKVIGFINNQIHNKGNLNDLVLSRQAKRWTLGFEASYGISSVRESILSGTEHFLTGVQLAFGHYALSLDFVYGARANHYVDWSYRLDEFGIRLLIGFGFSLGNWRIDGEVGAEPLLQRVIYSADLDRQHLAFWFGGGWRLAWSFPFFPLLHLQARGGVGALDAPSIALNDAFDYWSVKPYLEFGICLPFGF